MFRSIRTDIGTIAISVKLPASLSTDNALSITGLNSTALQITRNACSNQDTFLDVGGSITWMLLEKIKETFATTVDINCPPSVCEAYDDGLRLANFRCLSYKPRGTTPSLHVENESFWKLDINIRSEKVQKYHVEMTLLWISTHGLETMCRNTSSAVSDTRSGDLFPGSSVHREVGKFLKRRSHVDLDTTALEASQVAFNACENGTVPLELIRFKLKLSDTGRNKPAEGTTYNIKKTWVFNAEWHSKFQRAQLNWQPVSRTHRAVIALGSNVGNRLALIEQACTAMSTRHLKILKTSSLYETEAMYKTDQPSFLNGVCEVCLALSYSAN